MTQKIITKDDIIGVDNTSDFVNDGSDGTSTYAETDELPTLTSDLTNDGSDRVNPFAATASNGLTKTVENIVLGGSLDNDTLITIDAPDYAVILDATSNDRIIFDDVDIQPQPQDDAYIKIKFKTPVTFGSSDIGLLGRSDILNDGFIMLAIYNQFKLSWGGSHTANMNYTILPDTEYTVEAFHNSATLELDYFLVNGVDIAATYALPITAPINYALSAAPYLRSGSVGSDSDVRETAYFASVEFIFGAVARNFQLQENTGTALLASTGEAARIETDTTPAGWTTVGTISDTLLKFDFLDQLLLDSVLGISKAALITKLTNLQIDNAGLASLVSVRWVNDAILNATPTLTSDLTNDGENGTSTYIEETELLDSNFKISNTVDPTKRVGFDVSEIATATTRTITMPDEDVDLGAFALSNNSILLKRPSGAEIRYTPLTDTNADRGVILAQAITDFTDGDLIIVGVGVYDTQIPLSANLNMHFLNGAEVIYTGIDGALIYNTADNDYIVNITGNGVFRHSGTSGLRQSVNILDGTILNIEGKSMVSDNSVCIRTSDNDGGGSVITSKFNIYNSSDGTFDNIDTLSTINVYGDYATSQSNYVLENDGGIINCWVKKVESFGIEAVTRVSDGIINIYGTNIVVEAGFPAVTNSGTASDLNLYDCKIYSDTNATGVPFTGYYYDIYKGNFVTNGSVVGAFRQISASTTILSTDYTVECTANSFTVTLPTAVGITGKMYNITNTGTGVITVDTTSSQTINGSLTQTVSQWENLQVQSNGTNWIIL